MRLSETVYKMVGNQHKVIGLDAQLDLLYNYRETGDMKYATQIIFANYKLIATQVNFFVKHWSLSSSAAEDFFQNGVLSAYESLNRYEFNRGGTTVPSWIRTCVYNDLLVYAKKMYSIKGQLMPIVMSTSVRDKDIAIKHLEDIAIKTDNPLVYGKAYRFKNKRVIYKGKPSYMNKLNVMDDEDEHDYILNNLCAEESEVEAIVSDKLLPMLSKILTPREYDVIYHRFYDNILKKDTIYYIKHITDEEYVRAVKRGTNIVKINGEDVKVIYYNHYEGSMQNIVDGIYYYESDFESDVCYNGRNIEPTFDNGVFKYEIKLGKRGYVFSAMHITNIFTDALYKIRNYLIKNKIKSKEDYEKLFSEQL
jgi:DNA-directed RNA polymerase specialized sigma subunit